MKELQKNLQEETALDACKLAICRKVLAQLFHLYNPIRKVFGSTIENEIWKTVLDYLILLGVAAAIAIPIAIRLASRLLEQYAYRISGYGWVFVVTILITTIVAFFSVLWQTLKAARTNPAVELKKE